jgi:hypothetical protein
MPTKSTALKVAAEKAGHCPGLFFAFFCQRLVVKGAITGNDAKPMNTRNS